MKISFQKDRITQEAVMPAADVASSWIEAYLPAEKALDVRPGQRVTLYDPGHSQGASGMVTARGIVGPTPDALLPKMPGVPSSVYVRIDMNKEERNWLPGSIVKVVIGP